MKTFSVELLNPQALRLLADLADLKLIKLFPAVKKEIKTPNVSTHFASESLLARDWLTDKEDEAWANL